MPHRTPPRLIRLRKIQKNLMENPTHQEQDASLGRILQFGVRSTRHD